MRWYIARAGCRVAPIVVAAMLVAAADGSVAQDRMPNANACLVWIDSLLANAYFQVAKNGCDYAIRIEYRYETDIGAGCFGARPCTARLEPHETKRFTAGGLHHWACRAPAVPRFPDVTRDGWCE